MFKTILLSYDGSDHARHALAAAASLTKAFDGTLHLCHTPQHDMPHIVVGPFVSQLERAPTVAEVEEASAHLLADAKQQLEELGVALTETHVGGQDPAKHALQIAEDIHADVIVMGRRGLGTVKALALGSVSQAVAHGAKCACLTVA